MLLFSLAVPCVGGTAVAAPGPAPAPRPPTVSSARYPEGVASDPDIGVFRFGAHGVADIVRYVYSYGSDDRTEAVDAQNGTARVTFTPYAPGPMSLYVHSVDGHGRVSRAREYDFTVRTHGPSSAQWRFDEPAEARVAADDRAGVPAALGGDARFRPGTGRLEHQGDPQDGSLALGATDGGASTDGPVIDTAAPFTVTSWVRLTHLTAGSGPLRDRPVVSVNGPGRVGMWLGYDADAVADDDPATRNGTFVLRMTESDSPAARTIQVPSDREALTDALDAAHTNSNDFVSVTGVYYGGGRMAIFLNGRKAGEASGVRRDWTAAGPLRLGSRASDTGTGASLDGDLDHVQVFSSALFDVEVQIAALEF